MGAWHDIHWLKYEPALELYSRAAPSVEAHNRVNGPDTRINSGGRWIKNDLCLKITNGMLGSE